MNSETLINQVREIITESGFNLKTDRFLLGISGGIDSIVLLDIFHHLTPNILAAHFNHQLRTEADSDEEFVRGLARLYNYTYYSQCQDVGGYARANRLSIEEAARVLRYQFLFEKALHSNCAAVVVAHNADDQVETVLMHMMRGSGLSGLKGMPICDILPAFSTKIPIFRPLLGITRSEIEDYQQQKHLEFREDKTNQDIKYHRNRIRHELIPTLQTYNPNIKTAILRMIDNLHQDWTIVSDLLELDWKNCVKVFSSGVSLVSKSSFLNLSQPRQRNLLRKLISFLSPDTRDFGYDRVMEFISFIQHPSERNTFDLFEDLSALIHRNYLAVGTKEKLIDWLHDTFPYLETTQAVIEVREDQDVAILSQRWSLQFEVMPFEEAKWDRIRYAGDNEAWLNAAALEWPVIVRSVRAGDRFKPIGLRRGSVKVSDFYINEKIPGWIRETYPLLESAGSVAWVVGKRISEDYKVTESTTAIVRVRLIKNGEC